MSRRRNYYPNFAKRSESFDLYQLSDENAGWAGGRRDMCGRPRWRAILLCWRDIPAVFREESFPVDIAGLLLAFCPIFRRATFFLSASVSNTPSMVVALLIIIAPRGLLHAGQIDKVPEI